MKMVEAWRERFEQSFSSQIAFLLIVSVLFWALGVPTLVRQANAAYMSSVRDILSNSAPGAISRHTLQFTTSTSTQAGQTIQIVVDPDTSAFSQFYSTATTTDIQATGFHHVANVGACDGTFADQAYISSASYNTGSSEGITFTVCTSDTIAAGAIQIGIGSSTMLWQNPDPGAGAGMGTSYRITIGGTSPASGETRVSIISNVTLTASVASTFDFRIAPVPSGNTVGNDVLNVAASSTTLPFGTLASGTPKIAAQRLNVTTNATNGFAVTVQEDQPPTANSGSIIYLFKDGATTSAPTAWTSPLATLNAFQTYGHLGITSTDADLNSNEFSNATLYAGDIISPRVVFSHNGPANGLTNNQGSTTVAYKIQISDLQSAGDYTNTITYVATPTF